MSQNPYAVSTTPEVLRTDVASEAEAIRKEYLNHEASVQSIGTLYLLGGIIGILGSLMFLVGGIMAAFAPADADVEPGAQAMGVAFVVVLGGVFFAISALQLWAAFGLQKLKPAARIVASVLSMIGLLGFPLGTLISAYFLYLLLSKKGEFVFSDEYRRIREQTPHIRYRTSILVWIFLGLLGVLILMGVIAAIVGSR